MKENNRTDDHKMEEGLAQIKFKKSFFVFCRVSYAPVTISEYVVLWYLIFSVYHKCTHH